MLLSALERVSARVGETRKRNEKVRLLAECFAAAEARERGLAALYLSGAVRQAKLGVGYAQLRAVSEVAPAETDTLSIAELDQELESLANTKGAGSKAGRSARV